MKRKIIKNKKGNYAMIKLFSSTNCSSSKKMKQWLITNKLEFEEISILENTLLKKRYLKNTLINRNWSRGNYL